MGMKQVRHFKLDEYPEEKTIKSFISEAYTLTPSKQGLVPYKIHFFGPKNLKEKNALYKTTKSIPNVETQTRLNFQLFAPYVLLFTNRLCSNPNPAVQRSIGRGQSYSNCDLKLYKNAISVPCIEVGMFCSNLTRICLNNGLNIAYTACFPAYVDHSHVKFDSLKKIKDRIFCSMSIGYGDIDKEYLEYSKNKGEYKPHMDEIVDWY